MPEEKGKEKEKEKGKRAALDIALAQIEKDYGKGAIMMMGESKKLAIEAIPSGSFSLDIALGIGGVPRGRIVEIFGPESSGKTTLALHIMREAQAKGGLVALVDAEHAFDPEYAKNIGLNLDDFLISQPDTGEQALEIVETLVRSNAIDVVVIDSVAALVPRAEIEGEMGDAQMGLQARLMSQALRKLTAIVSKSKTCVIFINQIRMKIGIVFGNPETTTGGMALKFYSSVRMDIRRIEAIKENDVVIGSHTRVKVIKNKVAPPFRTAEFDIIYPKGIDYAADVLDQAVRLGVAQKSGAWYLYGEDKLGQGRAAAAKTIRENKAMLDKMKRAVLEQIETH